MDVILTLHADHELNASTFALEGRGGDSGRSSRGHDGRGGHPQGPRHGGANEDVLAMLHEIGDPARAEAFVDGPAGRSRRTEPARTGDPRARIPGFGHRVYKVDDARARVIRGMAKSMAEATGRRRLFEVAEAVYDAMKARTSLPVNVDFFSAVVYDALGTPTSAPRCSPSGGWLAGAPTRWSSSPTTVSSGPAPTTRARRRVDSPRREPE